MKEKQSRRFGWIIIGLFAAIGLVAVGAIVSLLVYRSFVEKQRVTGQIIFHSDMDLDRYQRSGDGLNEEGVLIFNVDENSPAAKAGLRRGSIILEVEGDGVNSPAELVEAIREHKAGDTITLKVLIGDETENIAVTLASAAPYLGVEIEPSRSGSGTDFYRDFRFYPPEAAPPEVGPGTPFERIFPPRGPEFDFDDGPFHRGLTFPAIVMEVVPDSPAESVGLQHGDRIIEVDGQEINGRDALIEIIAARSPGDELHFSIERNDKVLEFSVTLDPHPDDPERGFLGVALGSDVLPREFYFDQGQSG